MSAEADFYLERDRLLAGLVSAREAFHADRTAATKEAYDEAREAYGAFRAGVRVLAYVQRGEGDPYRVDAEKLLARGDFTQEA